MYKRIAMVGPVSLLLSGAFAADTPQRKLGLWKIRTETRAEGQGNQPNRQRACRCGMILVEAAILNDRLADLLGRRPPNLGFCARPGRRQCAHSNTKERVMNTLIRTLAATTLLALMPMQTSLASDFAPYGTAKVDMHTMPVTDAVFDVNYEDPQALNTLYNFIRNTRRVTNGKVVVVTHGPELRAFAKENYIKYQSAMDKMAELAKEGVEFKMCFNAMKAAGYAPEDMHGFVTIVPAGFPEVAYWQGKGYKYINPLPLPVKDVRYLDQPQLKK